MATKEELLQRALSKPKLSNKDFAHLLHSINPEFLRTEYEIMLEVLAVGIKKTLLMDKVLRLDDLGVIRPKYNANKHLKTFSGDLPQPSKSINFKPNLTLKASITNEYRAELAKGTTKDNKG